MKNTKRNLIVLAMIAALAAPLFGQMTNESQCLDVLKKTDASQKEKFDACRDLARIGTKEAVPALASLLEDEKYSHMARFGLEPIPDPSVDDAFRAALGTVKGKLLVGVINSIGARRDEKAAAPLAGLLHGADNDVALAASASLAKIGSKDAGSALEKALADIPNVVSDGCLRYGAAMLEKGRESDAAKMFDAILAAKVTDQIRLGAIRGAILAKDDVALLAAQIKGGDAIAFSAALRAAQEAKGSKWSKTLAAELAALPPEKQIPVLYALGNRHDDVARPAVTVIAKDGKSADVRIAAIQALTMIGSVDSVSTLIELMAATDESVAKTAKAGLASYQAKGTDDAIAALLKKSDEATRRMAIELLGQRRAKAALPELAKILFDGSDATRMSAAETIGKMGGEEDMAALLHALMCAGTADEMKILETAIASIVSRNKGSKTISTDVVAACEQAKGTKKASVVRLLAGVGGAPALAAVRAAATDSDAAVKDVAQRALCDWPTADALPDLLAMAKMPGDSNVKILALRGAIRLVPLQESPADKKAAALAELFGLATRTDEKKLVLSALGGVATVESLAVVTPQIASAELAEEASLAAIAVAEAIGGAQGADALQKVAQANVNPETKKRAQQALGKIRK